MEMYNQNLEVSECQERQQLLMSCQQNNYSRIEHLSGQCNLALIDNLSLLKHHSNISATVQEKKIC